jgi:hypothetical protein
MLKGLSYIIKEFRMAANSIAWKGKSRLSLKSDPQMMLKKKPDNDTFLNPLRLFRSLI